MPAPRVVRRQNGGSTDGYLAALDSGDQLGRTAVENFAGALHRSPPDVEHVGGTVLRGCANWRMLIRALLQRRDLPRDHGPLIR